MSQEKKTYKYNLPKGVEIEPTNLCNLKCPLCPCGDGKIEELGIPRGMMTFDQFKLIIDQVKDYVEYIVLWGFGEPSLVPNIDKMIEYASSHGISVITSLNGNYLNHDLNLNLINAEPCKIIFAIDGLCQETYQKYRVGGDFMKAFRNLCDCIDIKKKSGKKRPLIYWQFMIMRHNEDEVPQLLKKARELGVDGLLLKKFTGKSSKFKPSNPRYIRKEPVEKKYECKFLHERPVILVNGDVSVCSRDFRMKYVMGNIFKEKLRKIWGNNKIEEFRKNYYKNNIAECKTCQAKLYDDHFIEYKFYDY